MEQQKKDDVLNQQQLQSQKGVAEKQQQDSEQQEVQGVAAQKAEAKNSAAQKKAGSKAATSTKGKTASKGAEKAVDRANTNAQVKSSASEEKQAVEKNSKSAGTKKEEALSASADNKQQVENTGGAQKKAGKVETAEAKKEDKKAEKVETTEAKKEDKKAEKAEGKKEDKKAGKVETAEVKKEDKKVEKSAAPAEGAPAKEKSAGKKEKTAKQKSSKSSVAGGGSAKRSGGASGGGSVGGGGGSVGGAISVPKLGGGAPKAPAPIGEVSGKNAIDGFTKSGLSYQAENYAGLGDKASVDVEKAEKSIKDALPGEKGGEINDGAADQAQETTVSATKSKNETIRETGYDDASDLSLDDSANKANVESAKNAMGDGGEDIPSAPRVELDTSGLEQGKSEEAAKYASAQKEGLATVTKLDRTLPTRGFADLKATQAVIEGDKAALQTGELSVEAEIAQLDEEGKGLLDITDLAETTSSQMSAASAQIDEAEAKSQTDTQAKTAEHEAAVEQAKAEADLEEKAVVESNKAELDSQVASQNASFEAEISGYDAEQQAEIESARSEMETERGNAQAKIDSEHAKAKSDKDAAEKSANDQKAEKKNWLEKAADWVKDKLDKIAKWLKEKVVAIVKALKKAIFKFLDTFAAVVSKINKNLGNKLKKAFARFKAAIEKLAQILIDLVTKIIDALVKAVKAILDKIVAKIESLIEAFKEAIDAILNALRAAYQAALELIKAAMSSLGDFFLTLLKKALEYLGVDTGVFASAMGAAREIIKNPGQFFSTLGTGFVQGFKQFGANIKENVKAVFSNLFNMWLGTAGLSLPGDFSAKSLIQFGLQVIGLDLGSILSKVGLGGIDELTKIDSADDFWKSSLGVFIKDVQAQGFISAVTSHIAEFLSGLAQSIMEEAIKLIVQKAATAALSKLAMLATPVSGILAALKAVWDLIQFVRSNMAAINGLVAAVTTTLGAAAQGDSSTVASGVEAALCRLIPLAIDLLLRLAGLNVGGQIQKIVGTIRSKVNGAVSKLVSGFKGTKVGKAVAKGRAKVDQAKNKVDQVKEKAVSKVGDMADKGIAAVDKRVDPAIQNGLNKFNDSKTGKGIASLNDKAKQFANKTNAFTESAKAASQPASDKIAAATKAFETFNKAEKTGDAYGLSSENIANAIKPKKDEAENAENAEKTSEPVAQAT